MTTHSPDRTAILIVRLWLEANAHGGLRARITQTLDSTNEGHTTSAAATTDDIYSTVQSWVESFVAQP